MTKFEECVFQACDALTEAKKWFSAGDVQEAELELRRAQREIDAVRTIIAKECANRSQS